MAIYALGRLEAPAAGQAITAALSEATDPQVQVGLINALANRHAQAAEAPITALLESSDANLVQRACVRTLGRMVDQPA